MDPVFFSSATEGDADPTAALFGSALEGDGEVLAVIREENQLRSRFAVASFGDPHCVLLCHFDGEDGSTTLVDDSPSNHSVTGGTLDSDQAKFGSTSCYLNTFTILTVACVGCCSLAPVMLVNDETYGKLDPKKIRSILRKIRRESAQKKGKAKTATAQVL